MSSSEQGSVVVGGVRLAYDRSGEGEPVLFVCGTGMPRIAWMNHCRTLEEAGYQTVVFDSRGVGDSDAPPPPYTIEEMTADTAGLVEQLGIAPCHVIGLSQGGMIAEELTRARPDLVRTAVLMGSAGRETAFARLLSEAEIELAHGSPQRHVDIVQTLTMNLSSAELQDDAMVGLWAELIGASDWSGPGRIGQEQANLTWGERDHWEGSWVAIRRPVLVMAFEHDILLPPAAGREAASHMPHGEFVEIEGVGHGGAMTKADEVCRLAMEFFARGTEPAVSGERISVKRRGSGPYAAWVAEPALIDHLRADLRDAMKRRDTASASTLRSVLGAIANAEAVTGEPAALGSDRIARSVGGLGAGDVPRRELSQREVEEIVGAEAADRDAAAEQYDGLGQAAGAVDLRRQAAMLRAYLP